jgi:hypothetical protein
LFVPAIEKTHSPVSKSPRRSGIEGKHVKITGRIQIYKDLAVEQEVIEPAEVRDNPEAFRCIGEEVTEMLGYQPAKFFRRQIIRRKFVRRDQAELAP